MPSAGRTASGRVTSRGHWSGRRSAGFQRLPDGDGSFGSPRLSLDSEQRRSSDGAEKRVSSGGAEARQVGESSSVTEKPHSLVHAVSMPDLTRDMAERSFDLSSTAEEGERAGRWDRDLSPDEPLPGSPTGRTLSGGRTGSHQLSRTRSAQIGRASTGGVGATAGSLFQSVTARYTMDGSTVLGSGGYAVVRRAVRKQDGEEVAIKIMRVGKPQDSSSDEDEDEDEEAEQAQPETEYANAALSFEEIMTEIDVVQQLHHDNIVNIYEYFVHRGSCFIVMKLLRGKELMDALLEHGPYTETDVRVMMGCLFDAVGYMHLMNVTHRDLKLENLVLSRPGDLSSVTIVDFGLAKAARAREKMEDVCGTLWYYAPEIVNAKPYTPLVDEWALGVAMYLLLTGKFPFEADDDDEETLCELIANGLQADLGSMEEFEDVSDLAVDVLQGLLTLRPEERLPAAEALEHPWVTGSDNLVALQASTAKSLHHVHTRLQKLVATTGQRGRQFGAGTWIIEHSGEADTEPLSADDGVIYLVTQGECELLVRRSAGDFVRVGKRRQGNFIGEGQVLLSAHQLRSLAGPSPPTSPLLEKSADPTAFASSPANSADPPVFARSSPVSSSARPAFDRFEKVPQKPANKHALTIDIDIALGSLPLDKDRAKTGGGIEKALGERLQVQPLSLDPEASFIPAQSLGPSTGVSPISPPQVSALLAAGGSNHLQTKHAVWVRAVTEVEAVELAKEDMQWALEDDYRLGPELREAMYMRRRQLRKKQKQAAAQVDKEQRQPPAATSPQSRWSPLWSPVAASRRAAMFDAMPDFVLDGESEIEAGGDPAFSPSPTACGSSAAADGSLGYTLRLNDYKAGIAEMMQEYFQAQEVGEVAARLAELQAVCGSAPLLAQHAPASTLGAIFVKKAVVTALDFAAREFELTAVLISALTPGMLKQADIGAAFKNLLSDLNDLALDVPTAPSLLPLFVARFVVEETLPSSFLEPLEDGLTSKSGVKALRAAEALLSSADGTAAVLHAWGGGGAGSVAHSKQEFAGILREYTDRVAAVALEPPAGARATPLESVTSAACVRDWLQAAYADVLREKPLDPMAALADRCRQKAASVASSTSSSASLAQSPADLAATGDILGLDPQRLACRRVRELGVPHFLWEFVRQAVLLATDHPDDHDGLAIHQRTAAVVALLSRASRSGLVLRNQFEYGFSMAKVAVQDSPTRANSFQELMQQLQAADADFTTQEQIEQGRAGGDIATNSATSTASDHSSRLLASNARQSRNVALREAGK